MSSDLAQDITMRQYLLGQLDEATRLQMEERIIREASAADALAVVQQDLCEDYLDGMLTPLERRGFEMTVLATPDGRVQLDAIRAIRQTPRPDVRPVGTTEPTLWDRIAAFFQVPAPVTAALAAVAVIATTASLALLADRQRLRDEAADAHRRLVASEIAQAAATPVATAATPAPDPLAVVAAPAAAPAPQRVASPLVALTLRAGALRGDGPGFRRVTLPAEAVVLRLTLEMAEAAASEYHAEITDADGERVMAIAKVPAAKRNAHGIVTLDLPARVVPPGDYQVQLTDAGGTGAPLPRYAFRVLRP